jgi:hypothetical protein
MQVNLAKIKLRANNSLKNSRPPIDSTVFSTLKTVENQRKPKLTARKITAPISQVLDF